MFDAKKFSIPDPSSIAVGNSEHPIGQYTKLLAKKMPARIADATQTIYYLRALNDKFVVTIVPGTHCFAVWDVTYEQFKQLWETQPWSDGWDCFPDVTCYETTHKWVGTAILQELNACWPELLA